MHLEIEGDIANQEWNIIYKTKGFIYLSASWLRIENNL